MLTGLTSNAWPQTSRGSSVLSGNHTTFPCLIQATLVNVYFRLGFLSSVLQWLLSQACFKREHPQAPICIPISTYTHTICLPATIKDKLLHAPGQVNLSTCAIGVILSHKHKNNCSFNNNSFSHSLLCTET